MYTLQSLPTHHNYACTLSPAELLTHLVQHRSYKQNAPAPFDIVNMIVQANTMPNRRAIAATSPTRVNSGLTSLAGEPVGQNAANPE
jgi:hypothetical protein